VFDNLQSKLSNSFRNLRGKGRITEHDVNATLRDIRVALLEADVNLAVVKEFIANVREQAMGAVVHQALNAGQQIVKIVNEELIAILGGEQRPLRYAKHPPTVIMLAGLQGSGKTTLAGKLGKWLKAQGRSPLLVAADLQRPNAVTQLQVVGERAGVAVYAPQPGNGVGDPVRVARDSIAVAQTKLYDVVIVDTAGRLGVDAEMMRQAEDIRDAVDPTEILFVIDAMIGQDAVTTAKAFEMGVGFDGVVLSKLDGDARGGAALSIARVTGKPIMFASVGEGLDDFEVFHPDRMASRILDMGDLLTLIEKAQRSFDVKKANEAAKKLLQGDGFTLDDFLQQLQAVRKMGPMAKVLSMMPGMAQYKEQMDNIDEREIDRQQAIIQSMTPLERANPKLLDGSRRLRIANGSGTTVAQVNALVNRFMEARKMMGRVGKGGVPGMPAMPGRKPGAAKKKPKKGHKVSGNPAKRAQELAAAAEAPPAAEPPPPVENPFGVTPASPFGGFGIPSTIEAPDTPAPGLPDLSGFELPDDLKKLFQ
jgi:signal recognition particle subunit SRP54